MLIGWTFMYRGMRSSTRRREITNDLRQAVCDRADPWDPS